MRLVFCILIIQKYFKDIIGYYYFKIMNCIKLLNILKTHILYSRRKKSMFLYQFKLLMVFFIKYKINLLLFLIHNIFCDNWNHN